MTADEPTLPGHVARLLSLPDACAVLGGLSRATLYREMARGRLASAVRLAATLTRGVCHAIPRFFAVASLEVTTACAMRP